MVNGSLFMLFHARDLGFQRRDPRIELGHRHRIEILARKLGDRIAGLVGRKLVHIHSLKR